VVGSNPKQILVFRDGDRDGIQNNAIVGSALWALSKRRARKTSMSDRDVETLKKLKCGSGSVFSLMSQQRAQSFCF